MANLGKTLLANSGLADQHHTCMTKSMGWVLDELRLEVVGNEESRPTLLNALPLYALAQARAAVYWRVTTRGISTRDTKDNIRYTTHFPCSLVIKKVSTERVARVFWRQNSRMLSLLRTEEQTGRLGQPGTMMEPVVVLRNAM